MIPRSAGLSSNYSFDTVESMLSMNAMTARLRIQSISSSRSTSLAFVDSIKSSKWMEGATSCNSTQISHIRIEYPYESGNLCLWNAAKACRTTWNVHGQFRYAKLNMRVPRSRINGNFVQCAMCRLQIVERLSKFDSLNMLYACANCTPNLLLPAHGMTSLCVFAWTFSNYLHKFNFQRLFIL